MRSNLVLACAAAVLAGGCLGDLVPLAHQQQNNSAVDGGGGGNASDFAGVAPAPDLSTPNPGPGPSGGADLAGPATTDLKTCLDKTTPLTDGHHNVGADCLTCHNGTITTLFTVGGTLYDAATGGTTVAGATIELTDANGNVLRIISSTNGNFYSEQPVTYPVHARATACPADNHMSATAATGACNSCHEGTMRVHVP